MLARALWAPVMPFGVRSTEYRVPNIGGSAQGSADAEWKTCTANVHIIGDWWYSANVKPT